MMFPSLVASYDAITRNHFILAEGTEDGKYFLNKRNTFRLAS